MDINSQFIWLKQGFVYKQFIWPKHGSKLVTVSLSDQSMDINSQSIWQKHGY